MRKRKAIIWIVVIFVGILLICTCLTRFKSEQLTVSEINLTERNDLRVDVKTVNYDEKIVTLRFSNVGNDLVEYNPWVSFLDKKKDSTWYSVERKGDSIQAPAIRGALLEPGETEEKSYDLDEIFVDVSPGTYRIYFNSYIEGGNVNLMDDDICIYVGVEFDLVS